MELAHVPGHAVDSVTFYLREAGELYSGDTLFAGSIGRADLPGGDPELLIDGIRGKLFALPEATVVYPGHGPATSIGAERAANPYCGD
jgi:glyoxylase-like metal-dependent hydrolase (beta-lactamase superfamily II)